MLNAKANPTDPCWLRLSYVNAQRQTRVDAHGNPLTFETTLPRRRALAFDFASSLVQPPLDTDAGRIAARPVVERINPPAANKRCAIVTSIELFDRVSGATLVAWPPGPILPVGSE